MIKFYEPAVEEEEPIGDYCPSIDNEPPVEPKQPFGPLWKTRKTGPGERIHELTGKTFYTGLAPYGTKPIKWSAVDTSPFPAKFEPVLSVSRDSVARLFRYLRKEARGGH